MDKTFFETLQDRRDAFAARSDAPGVAVELALHSGRVIRVESVVETADTYLQLDGVDRADEDTPISIAVPYHQVAGVVFVRERVKLGKTGF